MTNAPVTKIYKISTLGYTDLHSQLQQVQKDFAAIKQAKIDAEKAIASGGSSAQTTALKQQLNDIKVAMAEMDKQSKQLEADLKAQQIARKDQIQQIKDATALQNAQAQQQAANARTAKQNISIEVGSYNELLAKVKEFYAVLKNTPKGSSVAVAGQSFTYDEAIAEFQRLSAAEQAFRRQFTADKTLVGEYTSGIVQAFKQMGLGDVIGGQVQKANEKLSMLKSEINVIKEAILQIGKEGQTGFDRLNASVSTLTANGQQLDERFIALNQILQQSGGNGAKAMELLETHLLNSTNDATRLTEQIGLVNSELHGMSVGGEITAGISNGFKEMGNQMRFLLLSYAGFIAIFNGLVGAVKQNEELSDSLANLQIFIHGTKEEANGLFQALKQIDTRTNLPGLVDIANTVAQKGVDKSQIADVTKAFDEYFTVMSNAGKSEDVHEGVFTIAKLISIFNDDHEVTAERVTELGNAIFALKTSGPVSNEFLQGFAERVGAIRSLTGATIPEILGFGAAFQQLGQSEEVAGSATSILLTKMFSNLEKFAAVAGLSVEKLRAVAKSNPFEALLQVAEALKTKGAEGQEAIIKLVGDLGVNAVRARGAFSELINNAELFRTKMAQADTAITDTSGELGAFQIKQENFGATVDKIGKAFMNAFSNPNLIEALNGISKAVLAVITALTSIPAGFVLTVLSVMTAGWLAYKGGLTVARLEQDANNSSTLLGATRLALMRSGLLGATAAAKANAIAAAQLTEETGLQVAALEAKIQAEKDDIAILSAWTAATVAEEETIATDIAAKEAHIVALEAEVAALEAGTVATESFTAATAFSPIGALITLLLILVPALTSYGAKLTDAANDTKKLGNETQDAAGKFRQLSSQVATLQSDIDPLLSKYDELSKNTNRTADEQAQLQGIINDVVKAVPGAVTQWDRYGNAIAISTQRVRELIKAQQDQLTVAHANALDEYESKVQDINKQLLLQKSIQDEIAKTGTFTVNSSTDLGFGVVQTSSRKASQEEVKASEEKYKLLLKQKEEYDKQIALSNGSLVKLTEDQLKNTTEKPIEVTPQIDIAKLKGQIDEANKEIENFQGTQKDLNILIAHRNDLQAQYNKLLGEEKAAKADKLTANDKNSLNSDDAKKDAEISQLKVEYEAIKQYHELTTEQQVEFITKLNEINNRYAKIKIDAIKGDNAAEKAERAKLNLEIIDNDISTNEQIKAIYTKAFEEKAVLLKKQYETNTATIKLKVQVVQDDPDASFTQKAVAQQQGNQALLNATNDYYAKLEALAGQLEQNVNIIQENGQVKTISIVRSSNKVLFGIQEERNKAITDIVSKGLDDQKNIVEAKLKDIEVSYEKATASIQDKYDSFRSVILGDSNRSEANKDLALSELNRVESVEQATKRLQIAQKAYSDIVLQPVRTDGKGSVTDEVAEKLHHNLTVAQQDMDNALHTFKPKIENLNDLFTNKLANIFNFNVNTAKGIAKYQALADTISMAFQTAGNAMNAYFDSEKQRIDASVKQQEKLIDVQTAQLTARSQSQAESTAIEATAQAKKDAIEKAAFEKEKKGQIAQTEINLVTQLGNLAVIAFSPANPLNLITGGAWGAIFYSIQAALAIANAAINIKKIKSATYDFGGNPDMETTRGGRVKGRKHTDGGNPFVFKGRVFEDEVDELNVIRTKNVSRNQRFTVTGTQSQIASALNVAGGGKMFDAGAILKRFDYGGGVTLQKFAAAPVFVPSSNTTIINNSSFGKDAFGDLVGSMQDMVQATNDRIDRLEVVQQTNSVTKAQRKEVKQKQIGTL